MNGPLVSVLIDTYNHERFIKEAVGSVLAQDFPPADREIIVVDDGSTDRTPEILREFESQVRILRKSNGGQASAFNLGIPQCRGEIIAFLDGDDWWAPAKLSAVAAAFAADPQVGLIGHSITEVLEGGIQRSELVRDDPRFQIDSVANAKIFRLRKSFLGASRMAFRTGLLRKIGTVPEALVVEADEFLFTLGALFSEVFLLRDPLTYYRLQGQNLFQNTNNLTSIRRKHAVMVALADSLRTRFEQEHVPQEILHAVVDAVQIEADMLRLSLGEGSPWQNFRAELREYHLHHENASLLRRSLKLVSALPALFLPVRTYNALKRSLFSNDFYVSFRDRFFPFHHAGHVDRTQKWKLR
ncbi:MAG TPA: glycosyltransferase [Candidatus Saccharimonadales bacterium]|nr:glycosyltransferase [Candidatus Saccharimonadales bacterium]